MMAQFVVKSRMHVALVLICFACRSGMYSQAFTFTSGGRISLLSATKQNVAGDGLQQTVTAAEVNRGRFLQLKDALRSFNSTYASDLLTELSNLRTTSSESTTVDSFLDELLSEISAVRVPLWAKAKFLTRFSNRARLYSLGKTLDLITPPPSEETLDTSKAVELEADLQRRRRRALLSLIRTLSGSADAKDFVNNRVPAIRQIERKARKELRSSSSREDMMKRRPTDLETPSYSVIGNRKDYEIRKYESFSVCSVNMAQLQRDANPDTDAAVNEPAKGNIKAFGALAGYLFGKNQQGQAMKMTTPVLTTEDKRMSFVLPSEYWKDQSEAPRPFADSGVKIESVEGAIRAVVMFGGYAVNVAEKKRKLLQQVKNDKEWLVVPGETAELAQYNDPFTPPWKRLNEVSILVQKRMDSVS